jgi:large subunit ribosomal protein L10
MSKQIKQMEMDALRQRFQDVRDLVVLSSTKVNATADNQMRLGLRKKNIHLQVVKNSLTKRVFDELGMKLTKCWEGPTLLAWGAGSLAELSKELDAIAKKNKNIQVKVAVSEGQEIEFKQALAMPTRAEAIARVVGLAMAPAARLVSMLQAPGGQIAAQIKTLSERKEGAAPESAAAPA